jgi:hypothetical protein
MTAPYATCEAVLSAPVAADRCAATVLTGLVDATLERRALRLGQCRVPAGDVLLPGGSRHRASLA